MNSGFYKRRRGILEHLEAGTIGLIDLAVHDYLCLKINAIRGNDCSIPAGICFSSSVAISAISSKEVSERTIRRSLEHLENIGWIKRWPVPGKHGNYPVLVARASVHDLSGNEYRVNAEATTDWRFPVYVTGEEAARSARGDVRELSTDREERAENEEEREKKGAQATPSLSFSGQHFSVTEKQDALLGDAFPWVDRQAQYRQADSWLEANPARRPKKASRFLHNWFQRIREPKRGADNGKRSAMSTVIDGYQQLEGQEKPN